MNLNIYFDKKNIIKLEKIKNLSEANFIKKFSISNKVKPILVEQNNFFGESYDLLIITKHHNYFYANFIQIGVDKPEQEIEDIESDLFNYTDNYKKNIKNSFDINIDYICLTFIFEYETQRERNYNSGIKFCIEKSINYYLFSESYDYFFILEENFTNKIKVNNYFPEKNSFSFKSIKINNKKKTEGFNYEKKKNFKPLKCKDLTNFFFLSDDKNKNK